jgi:hypothetical protein
MRAKKQKTMGEGDLFRARLDQILNMKHELVQLAGKIDWDWTYPMKARASAGSTTRISSTSPARSSLRHRAPLAQAHVYSLRHVWSCEACGYQFEDTVYLSGREMADAS